MSDILLQKFNRKSCKPSVPDLKPGQIVKVHQKIKEGNKERVQIFQGTVIAVNPGYGIDSTFTVRKISEKIGVEKVYPIHSPNIVKIEVLRAQKVRRSKLNFLRELSGKALRLKEVELKASDKTFEKEEPKKEVVAEEAPKAEESTPIEEKKEEAPAAEAAPEEEKKEEEAKAE